jgi:polyprenyl-phospho-N-acetylgalactosaminyl synthase
MPANQVGLEGCASAAPARNLKVVYFVIPAYNEGRTVGNVVKQVRENYPNVVVVDDGSTDQTATTAATAGAIVLRHLINRGQGAALKTGIDYALSCGAKAIVTFDSDGQHRLEDVAALLAPVLEGKYDVALGSRFLQEGSQVPLLRKLTLKLGVLFTRLVSGIRVTDTHNGLRALSRTAAEKIQIRQDRMAHASELLDEVARLKLRYTEVPTRIIYTAYSQNKGQKSSAALRIVWDFLVGKSGN